MYDQTRCLRFVLVGLMAMGWLGGCATTPSAEPSKKHVFYPAPPTPPRMQFLTSFSDALGMRHAQRQTSFSDWVIGEDRTQVRRDTRFRSPYGIAVHGTRLYVCDIGTRRVHVLDVASGEYRTLEASGRIRNPVNLTVDADGTKYLCDTRLGKVLIFDADDQYVGQFGPEADWIPFDLQVRGEELFVTNARDARVEVWSKGGELLRTIGSKGEGPDQFAMPTNMAIGPDGRLYVVDTYHRAVKVFDADGGRYLGQIGGPGVRTGSFARPKGIAIDDNGVIYVGDSQHNVVQLFEPSGQLLMVVGEPGRHPWSMGAPAALLVNRDAMQAFRPYLAADFEGENLLFVVNQLGEHKIGVFAMGRDTSLPASAYEVDMEAVEARRRELRRQATQQ